MTTSTSPLTTPRQMCFLLAELISECQRCFKPLNLALHKKTLLGICSAEDDLQSLDEKYEPLQLDADNELSVTKLLEDELLLAMPFLPLHSEAECSGMDELNKINAAAGLKPFAVLAALKNDVKK